MNERNLRKEIKCLEKRIKELEEYIKSYTGLIHVHTYPKKWDDPKLPAVATTTYNEYWIESA